MASGALTKWSTIGSIKRSRSRRKKSPMKCRSAATAAQNRLKRRVERVLLVEGKPLRRIVERSCDLGHGCRPISVVDRYISPASKRVSSESSERARPLERRRSARRP